MLNFYLLDPLAGHNESSAAEGQELEANLPKLLVTEKNHNSITLAWDDFRCVGHLLFFHIPLVDNKKRLVIYISEPTNNLSATKDQNSFYPHPKV